MARSMALVRCAPVIALALGMVLPGVASAHVERAAYWPDPARDCSISPCAGGEVPRARSLASALDPAALGQTRVVCQSDSMQRLRDSVERARTRGYKLRPSQPRERLTADEADRLVALNEELAARCDYHSLQRAVDDSGNNDRVVVMPGVYTEPDSRAAPTHDPACAKYLNDPGGDLSYRYQLHCPNDQALVNILGRALGPDHDGAAPPPSEDRVGIPNVGECIRCNLQIEGSGPRPEDVALDSGDPAAGNGGPSGIGSVKDVALRADRADGLVVRNFVVRHASEHDVYVVETDGYLLDRMKFFYAGLYGHLTFADDHGLTSNCEAAGSGDAGLYPGGSADTGTQLAPGETGPRYNQRMTRCDIHHNGQGTSGTMGNAVKIDHNHIYDNVVGLVSDSLYPAGHPGYPQDSALITHNRVYSNNFNMYAEDSDVEPAVFAPTGTGIFIVGGNDNIIRNNHIYDNWRRGTMLAAIPNAVSEFADGAEPGSTGGVLSTSYNNLYVNNTMGIAPNGDVLPNGLDFWWDQFPGTTGNRWCDNVAAGGEPTSDPAAPLLPGCEGPSIGTGDPLKEAELVACGGPQSGTVPVINQKVPTVGCSWFETPPRPGTAAAMAWQAEWDRRYARMVDVTGARALSCQIGPFGVVGGDAGCDAPAAAATAERVQTRFLQSADCGDWLSAKPAARVQIVRALAVAATQPDPENPALTLPDWMANHTLDSICSGDIARNVVLYGIYNRTAGFAR